MKVSIGPAGTAGLGYENGLNRCKELGLGSLEVEFTYGVSMKNEAAKKIGKLAKRLRISLSCHAPYYINLASLEKPKVHASKTRILQSCERLHYLGGKYVVFHAGFYQKKSKEEIYEIIKREIVGLQSVIKEKKWGVVLAPETTGKPSQFGDIDELLRLKKETGCHLCVDFSHIKARNNGKIDYDEVFGKIRHLKHIHSHFSGIEWTEKGERRHLITESKDIKELLGYIKKYNMNITIINESPDVFGDAVKMKRILEKI